MARAEEPRTTVRWDLDVYVALVTAAGGRGKLGGWVKETARARLEAEGFLRPASSGAAKPEPTAAAVGVGRVRVAEPAPPAGEAPAVDPRPAAGAAAPSKALLYVVAGKVGGQSLALRALRMGEVMVGGEVCRDPNAMVDPSAVAV